jgi:hypothetical protein
MRHQNGNSPGAARLSDSTEFVENSPKSSPL